MMTANCAPKLQQIDLRLINRAPDLRRPNLRRPSIKAARYSDSTYADPVATELVDSGTLVVARNVTANKRAHPVFDYFARAFDNTRASDRSMLFPVMRSPSASSSAYRRSDIPTFVRELKSVTNLKQYELKDKHFTVAIQADLKF